MQVKRLFALLASTIGAFFSTASNSQPVAFTVLAHPSASTGVRTIGAIDSYVMTVRNDGPTINVGSAYSFQLAWSGRFLFFYKRMVASMPQYLYEVEAVNAQNSFFDPMLLSYISERLSPSPDINQPYLVPNGSSLSLKVTREGAPSIEECLKRAADDPVTANGDRRVCSSYPGSITEYLIRFRIYDTICSRAFSSSSVMDRRCVVFNTTLPSLKVNWQKSDTKMFQVNPGAYPISPPVIP